LGSTQQSVLSRFYFALRKSAALTLAHRHKKKSVWWAFKKFGKDLNIIYKNKKNKELSVKFLMPKAQKVKWNINKNNNNTTTHEIIPVIQGISIPKTLNLICSANDLNCSIPNCPNKAENWHHVKHQKKIKGKNLKKIITAYTAKQIPVCLSHHVLIHSGKYDGPSLKKIQGYTPSDF
jgi:hypothetical protein